MQKTIGTGSIGDREDDNVMWGVAKRSSRNCPGACSVNRRSPLRRQDLGGTRQMGDGTGSTTSGHRRDGAAPARMLSRCRTHALRTTGR